MVSPLLSLMRDQVSKFMSKNMQAMYISGATDHIWEDILNDCVTHMFGSPEVFVGSKKWHTLFLDDAFSKQVITIAVDETHCIVKW